MDNASKLFDTRPVRHISLGSEACCDDQVLGLSGSTIGCLDIPAAFVRVELSASHNTFEGSMAFDVKNLVAVVKVIPEFLVGGII